MAERSTPVWKLTLLGKVRLEAIGPDVPDSDRGSRVVEITGQNEPRLLLYLALHQGERVKRSDVASVLWPPEPKSTETDQTETESTEPKRNTRKRRDGGQNDSVTRRDANLRRSLATLRAVLEPEERAIEKLSVVANVSREEIMLTESVWCDYTQVRRLIERFHIEVGDEKREIARQIRAIAWGKSLVAEADALEMDSAKSDSAGTSLDRELGEIYSFLDSEYPSSSDRENEVVDPLVVVDALPAAKPRREPLGFAGDYLCVGREAELAELEASWRDPSLRLLCMIGLGGMGKTTLARAFVSRLKGGVQPDIDVAVALIENKRDARSVAEAIAVACRIDADRIKHATDPGELVSLAASDWSKPLILLDGAEAILESDASEEFEDLIERLLAANSALRILCLSRKPLRRLVARVFPVGPMEYPKEPKGVLSAPPAPAEIAAYPAVELYRRTRMVSGQRREAYPRDVAHLCETLEGVPLAISIAAKYHMEPHEVVERFGAQIRRLSPLTGKEGHESIARIFDVVWDGLSETGKQVLLAASVFAGQWTFDALTSLLPRVPSHQIIAAQEECLGLSLFRQGEPAIHPTRKNAVSTYSMLAVLREVAKEKLAALNDGETQREYERLHARHYLDWFTENFQKRQGADWHRWMSREADNFERAISDFEARAETDVDAAVEAMDFCRKTIIYFYTEAIYQRGVDQCRRFLKLAARFPDDERILRLRSYLIGLEAKFHYLLSDFESCLTRCEEAQALRRSLGLDLSDPGRYADTIDLIQNAGLELGDGESIRRIQREILAEVERRRQIPELLSYMPDVLINLGRSHDYLGEQHAALAAFLSAREAFLEAHPETGRGQNDDDTVVSTPILVGVLSGLIKTGDTARARTQLKWILSTPIATDKRMLVSLVEHAIDFSIAIGDGRWATEFYRVANEWRRRTGKRDTRHIERGMREYRKRIEELTAITLPERTAPFPECPDESRVIAMLRELVGE